MFFHFFEEVPFPKRNEEATFRPDKKCAKQPYVLADIPQQIVYLFESPLSNQKYSHFFQLVITFLALY